MKKLSVIFASFVLVFGMSNVVIAQDNNDSNEASHGVEISIPSVALVDVENADGEATTINLTPDVSALEAGEAVDFSTANDNSLWLNYTSVVASEQTRNITAQISGTLPSGVSLKLQAGGISTGNGTRGSSAGQITLSETGQNVVTGIGSAYTESGENNGHQLTYTLDMNNSSYSGLIADDNYNVTVTYTITE
jgi:hypothetical protein